MATTSLWKIQNRIDKVINYTTNSEKTENKEMYKALHNTIEYATADYKTEKQIRCHLCGILSAVWNYKL